MYAVPIRMPVSPLNLQSLIETIIDLQTHMNVIVYDAFDLAPDDRQLIAETTKHPYGDV